jgi:hypothetical protein
MHWLHPDQEFALAAFRHRQDIATSDRRRLVRADATATTAAPPLVTRLHRAWVGLARIRPRGTDRSTVGAAAHAAPPRS